MEPKDLKWQVWWVYEGAWWGRKAKMLKNHRLYHNFLKGQGWPADANRTNNPAIRGVRHRKKRRFFIKNASCRSSELWFVLRRGWHFHKNHENMSPKNEKCCQNHVGYSKISPTWGRMHKDVINIVSDTLLKSAKEATCSNNTHICAVFWGPAWGAWSG